MFNKVTIIGLGLIGSSLARIILKKRLANTLVAADANLDVCKTVNDLGLAHKVTDHLAEAVEGADLVILAVPVGAMQKVAERIAPALKQGAIVTDTGSVKMAVIEAVKPYCRPGVEFVPGHPIAGTEFSGPEAGFLELFENRWCILTPLPDTGIRSVEKVTKLWEECGANIEIMEPAHHDLVLGITSHLPHLIAYTIVGTATDLEDDIKSEVIKFSASGFRDFTRIAASDPVMWRDIFLNNKGAVLEVLQRFSEDLTALQKAIRQGNGDYLYEVFTKTRAIRKQIVDIGQAE
ncbi:MAG: prephenate/arogenate dehydrogenase family protein [Alphaproteobacteria bacterium]|nr:prephenate/arogenate dehydrogenase family protein [Alphaproteobacteria bacterium]MBP7759665.1 prephenate/arogenate dehydrogenase family protein [Alphaproteobacteria bacterium]MBP7763015.1 prephenate/arogenate dehydrogenase family protein [Alphaproteobacteria bacterium]MBP7904426.1 prephenate/arogenate dehydrogenase family protein [Alphaproteobacteria bacterium]